MSNNIEIIKCYAVQLNIFYNDSLKDLIKELTTIFERTLIDHAKEEITIYLNPPILERALLDDKLVSEKIQKMHENEFRIYKKDMKFFLFFETFNLKLFKRFVVACLLQKIDTEKYHCFHGASFIDKDNGLTLILGNSKA